MKKWMIVTGIVAVLLALSPMLVSLAKGESEAEKLIDKPAPPLKLNLLDGKKINLEDHKKSKDIVVLDFWTTWCPPCRAALPIYVEVTKKYKDKHVVFYAVNLEKKDKEDKVRSFVKDSKTPFNVLLDPEGVAGKAYKVRVIPQSVIVDEEGIVRGVHIGAGPDLKETLKKELDALIEARDEKADKK